MRRSEKWNYSSNFLWSNGPAHRHMEGVCQKDITFDPDGDDGELSSGKLLLEHFGFKTISLALVGTQSGGNSAGSDRGLFFEF